MMNSFFNAQFNYCQLIWMLHIRQNNNIIRNLQNHVSDQYAMTKTYLMKSYLLKVAQSLYITEIYTLWQSNCTKLKMDFRQKLLLKLLLMKQSHYNLRRRNDFKIPLTRTVTTAARVFLF